MTFDAKPMIFPPGNVGGEFVRKVLVAGLLSKLDAGTPYNRWIFRGGLWFYSEKEAEKIPMGFDSEEGFTEMDKDCDMANGIRDEMMELKLVVVKKTAEEKARGEGQSPFSKMVKCDNFVQIFLGDWITKRGAPVDKTLLFEQSLGNKSLEVIVGALTVSPFPGRRLTSLLGAISRFARHELLGGYEERGGEILVGSGLSKRVKAECGSIWGILAVLGRLQIGSTVFTQRCHGVK
jgi:hypothetical protein